MPIILQSPFPRVGVYGIATDLVLLLFFASTFFFGDKLDWLFQPSPTTSIFQSKISLAKLGIRPSVFLRIVTGFIVLVSIPLIYLFIMKPYQVSFDEKAITLSAILFGSEGMEVPFHALSMLRMGPAPLYKYETDPTAIAVDIELLNGQEYVGDFYDVSLDTQNRIKQLVENSGSAACEKSLVLSSNYNYDPNSSDSRLRDTFSQDVPIYVAYFDRHSCSD